VSLILTGIYGLEERCIDDRELYSISSKEKKTFRYCGKFAIRALFTFWLLVFFLQKQLKIYAGKFMKKTLFALSTMITPYLASTPSQAQHFEVENACFFDADISNDCCRRFWLEADYLYWQVQNSPKVIPLVIEQPVTDGPFDVVLGGKKIKNDWHSGAKFTLGYWFDECQCLGAEVSYFFLGKNVKSSHVNADANGSPRLRVPYFNVTTGLPDSTALSTPGLFRGDASLKVFNRMQGAELNIVQQVNPLLNCGLLAGFRYWNFDENLTFYTSSPLVAVPTVYNNKDKFQTFNDFYGAQLGVSFDYCFSSVSLNVKGKVALGGMHQKSTIGGRFQTNEFTGSVQTFEGGYFALPTNIGHRSQWVFAAIPELNVNLSYQIMDRVHLLFGYSALYATDVLRSSKQMSRRVNPTQSANIEFTPTPTLVGEASPKAKWRSSDLWAQGINVGLDFTF
jgi:hypothetical protein